MHAPTDPIKPTYAWNKPTRTENNSGGPTSPTTLKNLPARRKKKTTALGYAVGAVMLFGDELILLPMSFTAGRHYQRLRQLAKLR